MTVHQNSARGSTRQTEVTMPVRIIQIWIKGVSITTFRQ